MLQNDRIDVKLFGKLSACCPVSQIDSRVCVVAAEHQGQTRSLLAAIRETTCSYFGWVDSDDLLAPTALEETTAVLDARKEVGLVYTDYQVINERNKIMGYGQRCRIPYSQEQLLVDFMIFHFRLLRRSVYFASGRHQRAI